MPAAAAAELDSTLLMLEECLRGEGGRGAVALAMCAETRVPRVIDEVGRGNRLDELVEVYAGVSSTVSRTGRVGDFSLVTYVLDHLSWGLPPSWSHLTTGASGGVGTKTCES